ncbi:radical SAM protein, partial [archaeon]|nr:radical SAM protein [archaeon]
QDDELNRRLFDHFDYLVHHEGEVAIRDLVERVKDGKSVEGVPKLVYRDGGKVKENLEFIVEDVNNIPAPDFDDLVAQGNHWTPKPVIPYLIGRGCDWGACTFCDIPAGYDGSRARMQRVIGKQFDTKKGDGKRRNQSLDKVIQELDYLSRRYDTKYFSFGDEELAGDLLRGFVDKVLESGLDIEWECYGRIEDLYLDKEFCEKLSKAGCRFIQFGVESASQKVLDMGNKGYDFGIAEKVLRNTYEAGIMNHAFLLVGLPGDSLVEASKLISFLERTGEYITTLKPIHYKVSKWSPIALHPEREGVKLDKEGTPDLDVNINLVSDSGLMSRHNAEALVRVLDLWTKYNHSANPATSEYMYSQRLFLSRDELEEFGRSAKPEVQLDRDDLSAIKKVYNGLVQEVKTKAYDGSVDKDTRREYEQMYLELKDQRAPDNLEDIVSLLRRTALVNNQTAYEPEESKDNVIDFNSYRERRWAFRYLVRPIAATASIAALVVGSWLYAIRQGIDAEKHVQNWGRTYFAQLSEQKPEYFNPIVRYATGNKSLDGLNANEVDRIATLWEMDATGQEFVIQSKNPDKLADYNAMCRFRNNS